MHWMDTYQAKWAFKLLSGFIIRYSAFVHAGSVAIPIGGVQQISPIPGPANPDPILENLQTVMDNHYQKPFYSGDPTDYLALITLQTNTYTAGSPVIFNPLDDNIMSIQIGQNILFDDSGTFPVMLGTNTIALSEDGGKSWSYGPPVQQIIPLGGYISQIINASLGPGLYMQYNKQGRLFASGQGFDDMVPNRGNVVPETGFLFTYSDDNGKSWAVPNIVFTSTVNWWFTKGAFAAQGQGPREFYTTIDPAHHDLIHANTMFPIYEFIQNPIVRFGNLFYFRSKNGGITFSKPKQVYSLMNDPVWKAKYSDPQITDHLYLEFGGFSLSSAHPLVVDQNVLLLPVMRQYPKIGSTDYSGNVVDTNFDQAVVRSLDKGKTWLNVAGATEQYILTFFAHDPGLGFGFDTPLHATTGQSTTPIVSPFTGRIYLTYAAGNPASFPDRFTAALFPYVLVSASNDQGAHWSQSVQINRTPTNISFDRQQAFGQFALMTLDGYYVVAYYDFRNWTGSPGEDPQKTPLQTDVWLDIYKEVDDPTGGSTGIGLDFVEERRVTPHSFDARIMGAKATNSIHFANTTIEGLKMSVNKKNQLFVMFSMTNESKPSNIRKGYQGMTIDTNNRGNIFIQRYQFPKPSNE